TDSFADAVRLVDAIAEVVAEVGHEPDLDVRPHGVTIRTCSRPDGALSRKDVELAQAISRVAHELGYTADPAQLVIVGIAVAQEPGKDVRPFWTAALGYDPLGPEDALDPQRRGPHLWFHDIDPPRPGRGRTHIEDRKSTRLNSSHVKTSYAVCCLKQKTVHPRPRTGPPVRTEDTGRLVKPPRD